MTHDTFSIEKSVPIGAKTSSGTSTIRNTAALFDGRVRLN